MLGGILNEWSQDYSAEQDALLKEFRYSSTRNRGDHSSYAVLMQFLREISRYADTPKWDVFGTAEMSDRLNTLMPIVSSRRWGREQSKEIAKLIDSLSKKFTPEAFRNPEREVRRGVQGVTWQIIAVQSLQRDIAMPRYWWRNGMVGIVFGAAAALINVLGVMWVTGHLSFLPQISYRALTLGTAAIGLAVAYSFTYSQNVSGDEQRADWHAMVGTLWPKGALKMERPRYGSKIRSALIECGRLLSVFVWWPLLFGVFAFVSYLGAAVFDAFGWSPTAGFNLVAVIAVIPLLGAYGVCFYL